MSRLCACGCGEVPSGANSQFCRGHNLNACRPAVERFWRRVRKTEGCWEWTGFLIDGYGTLNLGRGQSYRPGVHRFSYELHCGPVPEGLQVLHRCDNRKCVRPDHLFVGTLQDNMRDMMAKGRHARMAGDRNPNARLTREAVADIRRMRAEGHSRKVVAEKHSISKEMVSLITSGRAWQGI